MDLVSRVLQVKHSVWSRVLRGLLFEWLPSVQQLVTFLKPYWCSNLLKTNVQHMYILCSPNAWTHRKRIPATLLIWLRCLYCPSLKPLQCLFPILYFNKRVDKVTEHYNSFWSLWWVHGRAAGRSEGHWILMGLPPSSILPLPLNEWAHLCCIENHYQCDNHLEVLLCHGSWDMYVEAMLGQWVGLGEWVRECFQASGLGAELVAR